MTDVWITGYGAVTAAGPTSDDLCDALLAGRGAIRPLAELGCLPCAPVDRVPDHPGGSRLDRAGNLFVAAAEEAWRRAGLDNSPCEPNRMAVFEGSSLGPMAAVIRTCKAEMNGQRRARPLDVLRFMPGAGGTSFAQTHGIRGPVLHLSAGSVSAACAVGEACERISSGAIDVAIAGGSECPLEPSIVDRFIVAGVVQSSRRSACCRPFDRTRRGTVLGEGAGAVVLESPAHAQHRGALPRSVLSGYALTAETYSQVAPDPSGAAVCQAVERILHGNDEPGWIKAHGTGTPPGDEAEYRGLASVFGRRLPEIPVTSLKSTIGHCLGASGAVEIVATILALNNRIVPATLGTTEIDPAFELYSVALHRMAWATASALILAESFGGRCAALLLRAP